MRVVFRFDESPEIGLGHRSRCLALAEVLRKAATDATCHVTTARSGRELPAWIESTPLQDWDDPVEFSDVIRRLDADLVVVDRYGLTPDWFRQVSLAGPPVAMISDFPVDAGGCAYVIDQSPAHLTADYERMAARADGTTFLVGANWAMLRSEFFNQRHLPRRRTPGPAGVLVSLGGGDVMATTRALVQQLAAMHRQLGITVLTGSESPATRSGQALGRHDVTYIRSTGEIAALMARHDAAIGAGGVSALERCVVGLPAVNIALADNQLPNVRALALAGAALSGTLDDVAAQLEVLLENDERIRAAARGLCDGLGALRCVQQLGFDLAVELRPAERTDIDMALAFGHQTIPGMRALSRDESVPDWAAHSAWFDDTIDRPDRELFFTDVAGFTVGQIRLDHRPDERAEVSILVVPEAQGMGFATKAIRSVIERTSARVVAEVHPDNLASAKAFEKAGFVRVDDRQFEHDGS